MRDEVAKAIIGKNGAPLSVSEHATLITQIRKEAAQVHADMLEEMASLPKSMFSFSNFYSSSNDLENVHKLFHLCCL